MNCGSCGRVLYANQNSCACGWKLNTPAKSAGTVDRRCYWVEDGARCTRPGTIAAARSDDGPWYCSVHFFGKRASAARRDTGMKSILELQTMLNLRRQTP